MMEITLIGNAGFRIAGPAGCVYVDAFYGAVPRVGTAPAIGPGQAIAADLILVTHGHWDHFLPGQVAQVANTTGATVVGPAGVIRALERQVRPEQLAVLEPPPARGGRPANTQSLRLPKFNITAFGTFHGSVHNSYLVEMGGFRFFHDGDNEHADRIDVGQLGAIDALFIGPWRGAKWVEFIEALRPKKWFLMHLNDEELDQHDRGQFLPEVCDRVPPNLAVLRPGQSVDMP
jgi:L-ascorbate metabolism protein UlaG (beta-lactamase superfamily)